MVMVEKGDATRQQKQTDEKPGRYSLAQGNPQTGAKPEILPRAAPS
jgi:hypothetical protein